MRRHGVLPRLGSLLLGERSAERLGEALVTFVEGKARAPDAQAELTHARAAEANARAVEANLKTAGELARLLDQPNGFAAAQALGIVRQKRRRDGADKPELGCQEHLKRLALPP